MSENPRPTKTLDYASPPKRELPWGVRVLLDLVAIGVGVVASGVCGIGIVSLITVCIDFDRDRLVLGVVLTFAGIALGLMAKWISPGSSRARFR
jgi:hypothetical protein